MTDEKQILGRDDIVRPSKLPTVFYCPGALSLLIGSEKKPAGEAAEEGSRLHQIAHKVCKEARMADDLSGKFCWMVAAKEGATKEEFDEVIYPWICYTHNLLNDNHSKGYEIALRDDELNLNGTCDFIGIRWGDRAEPERKIFISDLKTGRGIPVEAEGNAQLRAYAALAYDHGKIHEGEELDLDTLFELSIFQPRSMHGPKVSVEILTMSDILEFRRELKGVLVAYQTATPEERTAMLNPGKHCRYCEAVMSCPAASAKFGEFLAQATPNAIREADPVILEQFCSDYETAKSLFEEIREGLVAAVEATPLEEWSIAERQGLKTWNAEKVVNVIDHLQRLGEAKHSDAKHFFLPSMPLTPAKLKKEDPAAYEALVGNMHQGNPSRSVKRVKRNDSSRTE